MSILVELQKQNKTENKNKKTVEKENSKYKKVDVLPIWIIKSNV